MAIARATGKVVPRFGLSRGDQAGRGWTLPLPLVALLVVGFVGPLLILILYSFGILGEDALGFARYWEVLADPFYRGVLISTLRLGLTVTLVTLLVGYPIAWAIARSSGRRRTIMTAILVAPLLTNIVVRTLGWILLLSPNGPINGVLGWLTGGLSFKFLGTMPGVVIALTHVFLPFMVLPMVSTLERIPHSIREAASVHGAHPAVVFWRVTLPLSMPGIVAGSTLVFLLSTGALVTPMLVGQGRVWVLTTLIFQQVQLVNWGRAGALAMTLFVAALAAITIAQMTGQRLSGKRPYRPRKTIGHRLHEASAALGARLRSWASFDRLTVRTGVAYRMLVFAFLLLPMMMVLKTAFDQSRVMRAGFSGLTLEWFREMLADDRYWDSLLLSVRLAGTGVVIALLLALPAAYAIVRGRFPGRPALLAFLMSPLTVPHMVLAVGFILFFQVITADPNFWRLLLVHLIIVIPYVVRILVSAFESLSTGLEESARTLGAGRLTTFRRISLPLIKPSLFAAALFAFLVSFDEVTITVLVSGSRDVTLPVRMFGQLTQAWTPAISALSALLIGITVVTLVLIEKLIGLSTVRVGGAAQ